MWSPEPTLKNGAERKSLKNRRKTFKIKKKMKKLILVPLLFILSIGYSQKINLTDREELIKNLDKKEFNVGQYGILTMFYDDYDKDFKTLKFKVEFLPASNEKKSKKIKLETDIFLMDGFYNPSYTISIALKTPGTFVNENYNFPTIFMLFENGELYFKDKTNLSMEDCIKLIKDGSIGSPSKFILCK